MNATAERAPHEAQATTPKDAPHAARAHGHAKPRRSRLRTILLTVAFLALVGWGVHLGLQAYHYEETDDAFVAGHLHTVSAQVDGQVQSVRVDDNQVVKAGDVLIQLDPLQFQIAVDRAKAAVAQARAQEKQLTAAAGQADAAVDEARAHVSQAEAQLKQTVAQLNLAKITLQRNDQLVRANGAAQAELDQARSAEEAATASNNAANANLVAARAAIASSLAAQSSAHAQVEASRAAVGAAEAALRDAERQLSYTTVRAPSAGRIGNRHAEPGNRVSAGQALLALAEPEAWVVANFKETQLAHMQPGQEVELSVDAVPGATLHGVVDSFAPASGAQFALLPPDNATGNFNKVVQRIPVKIRFDAESRQVLADRLRLGLSVIVNVRVR